MTKTSRSLILAAALLACGGAFAQSAAQSPIKVVSTALVASLSGKQLEAATSVPPGAKVLLKSTITNSGAAPAKDLVITNPVPQHMVFDSLSASNKTATNVTFSVDGVNFASASALTVKVAKQGVELTRAAQPSDYRFVRWTLSNPLPAGAIAEAACNATVE